MRSWDGMWDEWEGMLLENQNAPEAVASEQRTITICNILSPSLPRLRTSRRVPQGHPTGGGCGRWRPHRRLSVE